MAPGIEAPAQTDALLDEAIGLMRGPSVAVLTGAGVSHRLGHPRLPRRGRPRAHADDRARSSSPPSARASATGRAATSAGARSAAAQPNAGHLALAGIEAAGLVNGVITQNVDGLHLRAGSRHVVELHGGMDRVLCLTCGQHFARRRSPIGSQS